MPELPEIETVCEYLKNNLINFIIKKVTIRQYCLRFPIIKNIHLMLKNSIIKNIYRRAKYLIIQCYNKKTSKIVNLIIHLGMSGRLSIVNYDTSVNKHDHVDFVLNDNKILRYNDPRRFGMILYTAADPLDHVLLKNLGLEPFDNLLNVNYLLEKAKKQKTLSIKQFIMNNKIMVGVGNIYANEALYEANIDPRTLAKNLNSNHMEILLNAIRKILKQAILQGGTTLKDFYSPNGQIGKFVDVLKVYGKNNQSCFKCNTKIIHIVIGQRSTFYCPICQI